MIFSALHLLTAAFKLTIIEMGTSPLALGALVGIYLVSLLIAMLKSGANALREHWKKNVGMGLILLLGVWCITFMIQITQLIYSDHTQQKAKIKALTAALESTNDLFKDAAIEWDGNGNVVFVATALRSGADLHAYLDIRQGTGILGSSSLFEGSLGQQPRVEIGAVSHFIRDERLKITLATVLTVPGNQTVFQWGEEYYKNYAVGVNSAGYVGRIILIEKDNLKEYHSYFIVIGRSYFDSRSNSNVTGPALIVGPSILTMVKNWDAR